MIRQLKEERPSTGEEESEEGNSRKELAKERLKCVRQGGFQDTKPLVFPGSLNRSGTTGNAGQHNIPLVKR